MSDWNDLKSALKTGEVNDELIKAAWDDADTLITLATATAFRPIPENMLTRMTLVVGQDLYDSKNSPSGLSQFATYDGGTTPVRAQRDPLARVRPILAMYVVPF